MHWPIVENIKNISFYRLDIKQMIKILGETIFEVIDLKIIIIMWLKYMCIYCIE